MARARPIRIAAELALNPGCSISIEEDCFAIATFYYLGHMPPQTLGFPFSGLVTGVAAAVRERAPVPTPETDAKARESSEREDDGRLIGMLWRQSNCRMHKNDVSLSYAAVQLLIEFVSDRLTYCKPSAQFVDQAMCDTV